MVRVSTSFIALFLKTVQKPTIKEIKIEAYDMETDEICSPRQLECLAAADLSLAANKIHKETGKASQQPAFYY